MDSQTLFTSFHQPLALYRTIDLLLFPLIALKICKHLLYIYISILQQVYSKIQYLRKNHKTIFIIGHLIGLELFVAHKQSVVDNIYFDISCPQLVSTEQIKHALKEFGPGRLTMGSDTPYGINNVRLIISRIRSLDLSDTEKEMILGNNLKSILEL